MCKDVQNPCFGTQACLCDNGYFKITANMPPRPLSYPGYAEYVKEVEGIAAAKAAQEAAEAALLIAPPPILLPVEEKWWGFERW